MGKNSKTKQLQVEKDQAIAKYFCLINDEIEESKDSFENRIIKIVKKCLEKKCPISNDLLLIAFRLEKKINNNSEKKLSDILIDTCCDILKKKPIDSIEKRWFDMYIANSSVCFL